MLNNRFACRFSLLLLMVCAFSPADAQEAVRTHPIQVFMITNVQDDGTDQLSFVDAITGEALDVSVQGENYTAAGRTIIYTDVVTRRVMRIAPDGIISEHPFIQPGLSTRRMDWVVSNDGKWIVWTITDADSAGNLTTSTYLAETDGDNLREVLIDGPRADGLRALPVAISSDHTQVFMDYHPDGVSAFTPFDQYAGLFSVNVDAGNITLLPGEPGCFCGGAVGSETFLRLSLNLELNVFDVRVFNVIAGVERATLSGLELNYTGGAFTQAGDMLLSPDERYAVYALAQVRNFGTDFQSVRTVFALVDLQALTVRQISDPIIGFVHPAAFTENSTAVIFTSSERDGTWKITLADSRLDNVSNATYLGLLPADNP